MKPSRRIRIAALEMGTSVRLCFFSRLESPVFARVLAVRSATITFVPLGTSSVLTVPRDRVAFALPIYDDMPRDERDFIAREQARRSFGSLTTPWGEYRTAKRLNRRKAAA